MSFGVIKEHQRYIKDDQPHLHPHGLPGTLPESLKTSTHTRDRHTLRKLKSRWRWRRCWRCFLYLDLLALRGSAGLLGALLPLLGFTAFDSVDGELDAGGGVLGGGVGDGGGRHVLIAALRGTALSSCRADQRGVSRRSKPSRTAIGASEGGGFTGDIFCFSVLNL